MPQHGAGSDARPGIRHSRCSRCSWRSGCSRCSRLSRASPAPSGRAASIVEGVARIGPAPSAPIGGRAVGPRPGAGPGRAGRSCGSAGPGRSGGRSRRGHGDSGDRGDSAMAERYDVVVIGGGISGGSGQERRGPRPSLPGHPAGSAPGAGQGGGVGRARSSAPGASGALGEGNDPRRCVRDKSLLLALVWSRCSSGGKLEEKRLGSAHGCGTRQGAGHRLWLAHPHKDGVWTWCF